MQRFCNVLFAALLASQPTYAQRDSRPCGLKIAPCPIDQECHADSEDCADLNRCLGHCTWSNHYEDCGGFRAIPKHCDRWSVCIDDPREPESCGMACDIPGICVSKHAETCDGDDDCSDGLFCYETKEWVVGYGPKKKGAICL